MTKARVTQLYVESAQGESVTKKPKARVSQFYIEVACLSVTLIDTLAATAITESEATIHGQVSALGGYSAEVYFQWREAGTSAWSETPKTETTGIGAFEYTLTNLLHGLDYEFRFVADCSVEGIIYGESLYFSIIYDLVSIGMILIPKEDTIVISSNVPEGDNRDYMFDAYLTTQTVHADLIEVEVNFSNMDRVALFNIEATDVDLELTDNTNSTVVHFRNIDLSLPDGRYKKSFIEQMRIYPDATLKISINNSGADAKCGQCGVGLSTYLGTTMYGARAGFIDYSIKTTNEFGQTYLAPGNWAKNPELKIFFDYKLIDEVAEDLTAARGKWVFLEANGTTTDFESFRLMAFLKDWRIKADNPSVAWCELDIQGGI